MLRLKALRMIALLLVLSLVAAACGDDDVTDEPDDGEDVTQEDDDEDDDEADDDAEEPAEPSGDGLLLGYVLPETGPLAFLGPPQIESVNLAIEDINAAGGVLGQDVSVQTGDEAGDPAVASESAENLLGQGVSAIIGAAASGMSTAIVGQVAGSGVVMCSGSNTAPVIDEDNTGFYFRTAPTDELQSPALAEVVIGDGNFDVSIMARADDYGQGFLTELSAAIEEQGGTVLAEVLYDPEATSFAADVENAIADDPEAIVVIGFDEGAQVLSDLIESGYGPQDISLYTADGMRSASLWEGVDPDNPAVLEGMRGTAPGADLDYNERLLDVQGVEDPIFGGQIYDCVVTIALAAEAAGSTDPADIQAEMAGITQGGTECSSYEECLGLLEDGEDIDYQGVSGPIEWNDENNVPVATYEIFEFDSEGFPVQLDTVEGRIE
jgi:ABC-type branched-subunit amino acid transport system substrate-binding protein